MVKINTVTPNVMWPQEHIILQLSGHQWSKVGSYQRIIPKLKYHLFNYQKEKLILPEWPQNLESRLIQIATLKVQGLERHHQAWQELKIRFTKLISEVDQDGKINQESPLIKKIDSFTTRRLLTEHSFLPRTHRTLVRQTNSVSSKRMSNSSNNSETPIPQELRPQKKVEGQLLENIRRRWLQIIESNLVRKSMQKTSHSHFHQSHLKVRIVEILHSGQVRKRNQITDLRCMCPLCKVISTLAPLSVDLDLNLTKEINLKKMRRMNKLQLRNRQNQK